MRRNETRLVLISLVIKMKKTLYFLIVFLLLFTSCEQKNLTHEYEAGTDIPLSEFMIGKWESSFETTDNHGTYTEEYLVEIKKSGRLSFGIRSPHYSYFADYEYKFIDDDTLSVENRRSKGGQWVMSKSGENLEICVWSNDNCHLFTGVKE